MENNRQGDGGEVERQGALRFVFFLPRGESHTLQEVFLNRKAVNEVDNVSTLVAYQMAGGLIAVLLYCSPEL